MIGLIVPDVANPFFAELARSIEEAAFAAGKAVLVCNSSDDVERERAYLDALVEKRVDGIILAAASGTEDLADVLAVGIPIVAMDRYRLDTLVATVGFDDRGAGRLGAAHLLLHRRRCVGLIGGPPTLPVSVARAEGAREIYPDITVEAADDFSFAGGRRAIFKLLDLGYSIDGVICASDVQAVGVIAGIHERGLLVPDDIAVVSIDGTELGGFTTPPLTSVRQPFADMAELAVRALLNIDAERHVVRSGELVRRTSCGCGVSP